MKKSFFPSRVAMGSGFHKIGIHFLLMALLIGRADASMAEDGLSAGIAAEVYVFLDNDRFELIDSTVRDYFPGQK